MPRIGGAEVHQAFRAQDVLVRMALPNAEQVRGLALAIARALGGRDDEGAGRIGNETAVEDVERRGDLFRADHVLNRDGLLHVRVRMQRRVPARRYRHLRELLARQAVLVHVALRDHRVAARNRWPVRHFEVRVADRCGERRHGGVARESRRAVLPGAHEHGVRHARRDGGGGVAEHDGG